jgi:K+-sensing histidine kinase KdpD
VRTRLGIILIAVVYGFCIWVMGALLHSVFEYKQHFLTMLIRGMPHHEIVSWIITLVTTICFGLLVASLVQKLTETNISLSKSEEIMSLAELEKTHIQKAYLKTSRNKSQTAKLLGIGLNTPRRKLESYGMQ